MSDFYEYQNEVQQILEEESQKMDGNPNSQKPNKKGGKRFTLKVALFAAAFGIAGAGGFYGLSQITNNFGNNGTQMESSAQIGNNDNSSEIMQTSVVTSGAITSGDGSGVSAVAEAVLPSIVQIQVASQSQGNNPFGRTQESTGSGSGIIIGSNSSEILIATNNHVVEGANKVSIQFCDNEKVSAAIKGTDSTSDLAVVAVKTSDLKSTTRSAIKVATLGNSKNLKVGEQAIAVGNALGYGTSVTVGYISAKDRQISVEDASMKLLQTDAAINPGNSGGALVNSKGEVIGINSAKFASEEVEGMGFAIPISDAIPIINELMNKETLSESQQAYLGIRGVDVTEEYTQYYGMPTGIYIGEVTDGSPADKAGMNKGQIITKVNGKKVTTTQALSDVLSGIKAGTKGTITVQEQATGGYKEKEVTVTFGAKANATSSNS